MFYLGKREWFCSCVWHHNRIQSHQYACSSNHNKGKRSAIHNMITYKRFTNYNKSERPANHNLITWKQFTNYNNCKRPANHNLVTYKRFTYYNKSKRPANHIILPVNVPPIITKVSIQPITPWILINQPKIKRKASV